MSQSAAVINLVGRLTRDSELKYTQNGNAVTHFSVATDSRVKKGSEYIDEPSFWDCELWGKLGESLNASLTKGKLITLSGAVRIDRWEQDGQPRTKVKVTVSTINLLGGVMARSQEKAEEAF